MADKATKKDEAKPDVGMDLEAEAESNEAQPSEEIPGGVQTTDPTFADGAMEVESVPWNPPEETPAEPEAEPQT